MCAMEASVNASDFDRYFRAPVDAADRHLKKKMPRRRPGLEFSAVLLFLTLLLA